MQQAGRRLRPPLDRINASFFPPSGMRRHTAPIIAETVRNVNAKKNKKRIIFTCCLALIILLSTLLCVIFNKKTNYYNSNEFISLSCKEKSVKILQREGENNLNDEKNSYSLTKEYTKDNYTYRYSFFYISSEDNLGIEFVLSYDSNEITTSLFFNIGSNLHSLWMKIYNGNTLVSLGTMDLYAPTFTTGNKLNFDEYYGSVNQNSAETIVSENLNVLILTINDMIRDFNFSLSEFGFYKF